MVQVTALSLLPLVTGHMANLQMHVSFLHGPPNTVQPQDWHCLLHVLPVHNSERSILVSVKVKVCLLFCGPLQVKSRVPTTQACHASLQYCSQRSP